MIANLTTALGLTFSRFGYVGFMSDDAPASRAIPTLLAGLALGLLENAAFGARRTLFGALWTLGLLPMFGFWALIVGQAVVVTAVGVAVGALVGRQIAGQWIDSRIGLGLVVLLAIGAAGVARFSVLNPPPELPLLELRMSPSDPTVVVDLQGRSESADQVDGTLADVGGCLGLTDVSLGGKDLVVVWPLGTASSMDPLEIAYRGEHYRLGDRLRAWVPSSIDQPTWTPTRLTFRPPVVEFSCFSRLVR